MMSIEIIFFILIIMKVKIRNLNIIKRKAKFKHFNF